MARKTRQVETRLIGEYLKQNYSKFPHWSNQPLGIISEALAKKDGMKVAMGILRPFRPAVDGIVILPRHIVIVEAKVWQVVNGLGKLPLYKSLVPVTPELKPYMPREVLMQLVVAWTYPNLEIMARDMGVSLKVYCPDWLQEVVGSMHKYWTREYRDQREKKLRMREYFGIE